MKKIVILISGRGTNMEAVVRAAAREGWPAEVRAVVSNRPDAAGLGFAAANGIETAVVDHRDYADRAAFDRALAAAIDQFAPDLVVLAGFMRVLTDGFVDHYAGRMLNVHPSLLPCFPGLRTHQQALDAGVRVHGASVHFVTPTLDHGPIVAQAAVPVMAGDDAAALAARVLAVEHTIYPRAVRWFVEGRLAIDGERVVLTPPEPQWLFADIAGEGV
ncbi:MULTISPECIES: phosphoribosylglycinamide formyltransferase [unclassified Caballeronia]|uniref:phosphoribosylglycinamide formyltransferase n=1 Tax=unclassified Caballeronia TaxID=2646786 RepID=UPI002861CA9D|nr:MULTISPECIES: phosphoribosylglycinamide formyltransferase [unclassified Caballeronia]MDR5749762.1 phosphoribosylglycinamide formyltransferase [Caballeronia sp. LZ024]MDR5843110.1 phosphoribosylglycinamide formyltransferase [Caballeronia sp. LZ031]